jgi:hypothetical protein
MRTATNPIAKQEKAGDDRCQEKGSPEQYERRQIDEHAAAHDEDDGQKRQDSPVEPTFQPRNLERLKHVVGEGDEAVVPPETGQPSGSVSYSVSPHRFLRRARAPGSPCNKPPNRPADTPEGAKAGRPGGAVSR